MDFDVFRRVFIYVMCRGVARTSVAIIAQENGAGPCRTKKLPKAAEGVGFLQITLREDRIISPQNHICRNARASQALLEVSMPSRWSWPRAMISGRGGPAGLRLAELQARACGSESFRPATAALRASGPAFGSRSFRPAPAALRASGPRLRLELQARPSALQASGPRLPLPKLQEHACGSPSFRPGLRLPELQARPEAELRACGSQSFRPARACCSPSFRPGLRLPKLQARACGSSFRPGLRLPKLQARAFGSSFRPGLRLPKRQACVCHSVSVRPWPGASVGVERKIPIETQRAVVSVGLEKPNEITRGIAHSGRPAHSATTSTRCAFHKTSYFESMLM